MLLGKMASEGDINAINAANIRPDGGKKQRKGKKNSKKNEEMPFELAPSEALTSYSPRPLS